VSECIFCRILAGESEASIVFRDDVCTAFLTIEPVTPGHTLVVPNTHYRDIHELPDDVAGRMFQVAKKVAGAFARSGLRTEGVNVVMCNGTAASQTVFHAHIHVNPRFQGDGFSWNMPAGFGEGVERVELERLAAVLRDAIEPSAIR